MDFTCLYRCVNTPPPPLNMEVMVIELSEEQFGLKSYAWLQIKRARSACLISNHKNHWLRFQSKVAINEVRLPLYHIYFGSQTSVAQYNNFSGCTGILLIQCNELVCKKLQNLSLISCNLIDFFKQALKFVWLLCFSKAVSLAGKKIRLRT